MMGIIAIPFLKRKNKTVYSAFLKEGKKATWPKPIFLMYKNYFEYVVNELREYEFGEWLTSFKDSEEHIEFILRQFSEEQLIELSENYETWVGQSLRSSKMNERNVVQQYKGIDESVKEVLTAIITSLNHLLTKIKIK